MTKALRLVERLNALLDAAVLAEEGAAGTGMTTFVFKGFQPGGTQGGGATASTKNVEDHLRAKGYVSGTDYHWVSPLKLTIKQNKVDRDLLDSVQSSGGFESEEELEEHPHE
jgi:hypothetical protein